MTFFLETLRLGINNLWLHKLRSLLTALGIIFGVAAVIAMVAIGEGNKQKALADIRQLGVTNIILRSVQPAQGESMAGGNQRLTQYGLKRIDQRRIEQTVGPVRNIVPLKRVGNQVYRSVRQAPAEVYGTTPELREVMSLRLENPDRHRYLTDEDMSAAENVAVIGAAIAERLFPLEDPLGKRFMIDSQPFEVVGVLRRVGLAGGAGGALVGRDLNFDIHIPLPSAISRFGDVRSDRSSGGVASAVEISELVVRVPHEDDVPFVAGQLERVVAIEHAEEQDVTAIVPLELLMQAERTQAMFNALMIAIASISLLVGGIGIMNIMLASVTERTREIGVRRAMGATRYHIVLQFLVETTVLSGLGGVIGVGLGLAGVVGLTILHRFVEALERPEATMWSILVSFIVATSVGVVFGLYPAVQASRQDPIVALRHD
ncbi:MAG: ABC transporter permease [Planctomycetota bacterium]